MKILLLNISIYLLMTVSINGQTIFWDFLNSNLNLNLITHRVILIGDAGEPAKDINCLPWG